VKSLNIVLPLLAASTLALAQNQVSWVASSGNDNNPCTRALPCRTFFNAQPKTNAGGTIQAIDAADYGTIVINRNLTLDGSGTAAVIDATNHSHAVDSIRSLPPLK